MSTNEPKQNNNVVRTSKAARGHTRDESRSPLTQQYFIEVSVSLNSAHRTPLL